MAAILSLTLGHLCGHKSLICPDILQWPVKWHESFCDFQSVPHCSLIFKPIKSREKGEWFSLPWVLVPRAFLWASAVHLETGSSSASCQTQSQGEACLLMISLLPHSVPMCHRGAAGLRHPWCPRVCAEPPTFLLLVPEEMASVSSLAQEEITSIHFSLKPNQTKNLLIPFTVLGCENCSWTHPPWNFSSSPLWHKKGISF